MLDVKIVEEPVSVLPEYAHIPMSFEVRSVFEVQLLEGGLQGFRLSERRVDIPWVKDYDGEKEEGPTRWAKRWDISNWVVISAFSEGNRIGGCVIAYNTPEVYMLEGRKDMAVLWDLRVGPHYRRKGLGARLVEAAIAWSLRRQCRMLKVETQNINVPACRLYARCGFSLCAMNRYAYPELPDEVELIWCREL